MTTRTKVLCQICIALLFVALCPAESAIGQDRGLTVNVTVDCTKKLHQVDRHMLGINTAAWDSDFCSPIVIRLLKTTPVASFRYPGGSWADSFDWTRSRFVGMPMTKDLDVLAEAVHGDASLIVNYGSGSPQMAAAWAAYCDSNVSSKVPIGVDSAGRDWKTAGFWATLRGEPQQKIDDGLNLLRASHPQPYNFTMFEVGNECYGSWENDTHLQKNDPVLYALFFAQTDKLIKNVVPAAKLGAVITDSEDGDGDQQESVINPANKLQHTGWTSVLLSTLNGLGVVPDFFVYHYYPQQPGKENDEALLHTAQIWPSKAYAIRHMLDDYFHGKARNSELACTENNSVTFSPGKQTTSLVNGLYLVDSFGSIMTTEFHSYYWWNMHNGVSTQYNNSSDLYGWRNYGDYGALASGKPMLHTVQNTPYPTFRALQLMSHLCGAGDCVVGTVTDSLELSAYAIRRKNADLSVLLINKSRVQASDLHLTITGFSPKHTATAYSYGPAQESAAEHGLPSELVQTHIASEPGGFTYKILPYTMTVINMNPR